MPTSMMDLSVVLPSYRAAPLARKSVERLKFMLEDWGGSWEIVVVDDGGGDFVDSDFGDDSRIRLLRTAKNRGKGAAVCAGMLSATGAVRVFTDVDIPYDLDLIPAIELLIRERGFHVVIGDRTLPSSRYVTDISVSRRIASWFFTAFVGTVVTGGFFDTQCGLKGVRGDVADEVFRLIRVQRFAFDVELVYIALKCKLDVHRIPVQLRNNETSSVRLLRDATRGFVDVFRIKLNQLCGRYTSPTLDRIVRTEFDTVRARVRALGGSSVVERL